ncbi:hypothetical protein [Clostridium sp. DJ247]|uniref:hypothetical protein n=1 Tax=Clostridium sp. DJ247 TaxID=2726188 RepID=UPI001624F58C|nr:hypothetical protein [Clostridium sp. DJ247]MBC2582000.1 hypothetical protein [Clostridium sp. DJ247]
MKDCENNLTMIRNLVGEIIEDDLKYVDYYVSQYLGIFIPNFYRTFAVFKLKNSVAVTWTIEKNFAPKEKISLT